MDGGYGDGGWWSWLINTWTQASYSMVPKISFTKKATRIEIITWRIFISILPHPMVMVLIVMVVVLKVVMMVAVTWIPLAICISSRCRGRVPVESLSSAQCPRWTYKIVIINSVFDVFLLVRSSLFIIIINRLYASSSLTSGDHRSKQPLCTGRGRSPKGGCWHWMFKFKIKIMLMLMMKMAIMLMLMMLMLMLTLMMLT